MPARLDFFAGDSRPAGFERALAHGTWSISVVRASGRGRSRADQASENLETFRPADDRKANLGFERLGRCRDGSETKKASFKSAEIPR